MIREKNNFLRFTFGWIFCGIVFMVDCPKLIVYGQTSAEPVVSSNHAPAQVLQVTQKKSLIRKTGLVAPVVSAAATAKNVELQNTLRWNFGAKRQRGWYLYVSLIQHTIGTESGAETNEFARAVALWQQKEGIYPTGIIDGETLSRLIDFWQSRRLNTSVYTAPEDLLTAPIADFYDPTREIELLKVGRETYQAYKRMVSAAASELKLKDGKYLRIVSAFRSREYQAKLRAASPHSGRAGLAVNSPHFTGRTLDLFVGGEPTITKDFNRAVQVQAPIYKWLVINASRFGFYPYFYEPWHWEYVPRNSRPPGTNLPLTPQ